MYAMLTGQHPFHGEDGVIRRGILSAEYKKPEGVSEDVIDLLTSILVVDRKKRFTADDVMTHRWATSLGQEPETAPVEKAGKGKERKKKREKGRERDKSK